MKFPKGITKSPRPKMSNHAGRTWDQCCVILPDGKEITGWLDTTWGTRFHFEIEGLWRSGKIYHFEQTGPSTNLYIYTADLRKPSRVYD